MVSSSKGRGDRDRGDWEIETLVIGNGEKFKVKSVETTLKKKELYASCRVGVSPTDFHAIEQDSLSLFGNGVEETTVVRFRLLPISSSVTVAEDVSPVHIWSGSLGRHNAPTHIVAKLSDVRRSRRKTKSEALQCCILRWMMRNPGWVVVVGGSGARPGGTEALRFLQTNPSPLLDPTCPLRSPGRCLPASVAIACLLFLRRGHNAFLSESATKQVLRLFGSDYVVGSGLAQLARSVDRFSTSVQADPELSEVLHGTAVRLVRVRLAELRDFFMFCRHLSDGHPQRTGEDTNQCSYMHVGNSSLESTQRDKDEGTRGVTCAIQLGTSSNPGDRIIYVLRFRGKGVDHTFVVDKEARLIYDCMEEYETRLCMASLGLCAGLGADVDAEKLCRHLIESRRIVLRTDACRRKRPRERGDERSDGRSKC